MNKFLSLVSATAAVAIFALGCGSTAPVDPETTGTLRAGLDTEYASYTRTASEASFVDACVNGTVYTDPGTNSLTAPWTVGLYMTDDTPFQFNELGQVGVGQSVTLDPFYLGNWTLPSNNGPYPAVFPFWDDLVFGDGGMVCSDVVGSSPNRKLVVTWHHMDFSSGTGAGSSDLNFEVQFSENGDYIDMVYPSMLGGTSRASGAGATVGVQDDTATRATGQHNVANYGTGAAWRFTPVPCTVWDFTVLPQCH